MPAPADIEHPAAFGRVALACAALRRHRVALDALRERAQIEAAEYARAREDMERLVAMLIAQLDEADSDPDLEDGHDAEMVDEDGGAVDDQGEHTSCETAGRGLTFNGGAQEDDAEEDDPGERNGDYEPSALRRDRRADHQQRGGGLGMSPSAWIEAVHAAGLRIGCTHCAETGALVYFSVYPASRARGYRDWPPLARELERIGVDAVKAEIARRLERRAP